MGAASQRALSLLSPKQGEEFSRITGGRYSGTGMYLEDQGGTIVVQRVFPHTPAEDAGVREGDRIVAIDAAPFFVCEPVWIGLAAP